MKTIYCVEEYLEPNEFYGDDMSILGDMLLQKFKYPTVVFEIESEEDLKTHLQTIPEKCFKRLFTENVSDDYVINSSES